MRAIDTNVVVRLLVVDDDKQTEIARAIVEAGEVFIGSTVLLETEWVLRAGYALTPEEIAAGLNGLFGLSMVTLEEPVELALALKWMADGLDFADALHVARSGHCSTFVSFDRRLVKRSASVTTIPVELP